MLVVVTALPVAYAVVNEIEQGRLQARWQEEAARLGLACEGSVPSLQVSGTMNGVEVELVQSATYPAKQMAVYSYTARARVPTPGETVEEEAIVASYRTEPRRAEDPLARDVWTGLTAVEGWFVVSRDGMLKAEGIEPLLRRLVRTARAEAVARGEREEEVRRWREVEGGG